MWLRGRSNSSNSTPGLWKVATTNAVISLLLATVPLLHRFGPLAAPLVFVIIVYVATFVICSLLGTGTGMQSYYFVGAALVALYFGTERIVLASAFVAVGAALIIALELLVPNDTGLQSEATLFGSFIATAVVTCGILFMIIFYALREAARAEALAQREHEQSELLLVNMLHLNCGTPKSQSRQYCRQFFIKATILFVDIVGFTKLSETMPPEALVGLLNNVFSEIDDLTEKYDLEKIKTIGDAYMVVAGAPERRPDHAEAVVAMSLEIKDSFAKLSATGEHLLDFRIGIHSGPVVAGVIGKKKFSYDMWGDTVNTAARMESHGIPGEIQVSVQVRDLLKDKFLFVERGLVDIKGKGELLTYLLKRRQDGKSIANLG